MKTVLAVLMPVLILAGCAHTRIEQGLTGLVGQNVDVAVAKFGPPSAERQAGAMRIVEWNSFKNSVAMKTGDLTPPSPYLPSILPGTTSLQPVRVPNAPSPLKMAVEYCKVTLDVDDRNVVRDYHYDGNFEGCYSVARRL